MTRVRRYRWLGLCAALTAMVLLFAAVAGASSPLSGAVPAFAPSDSGPGRMPAAGRLPGSAQTLAVGSQQLSYTGTLPLAGPVAVYWDTPPLGGDAVLAVDSDGAYLSVMPGPDDEVRLIVQLAAEPLAVRQAAGLAPEAAASALAGLKREQARFLEQLAALDVRVTVKHQFVHVLNGLALVARARDRAAIAAVEGVRAVYADYQVETLLPQSVPLIGAPQVWAMEDPAGRPVVGTDIRVAIIDSGIDYDHPDLGGPGFPNSRVITGYNFISDTLDPWDDLGHGTHVAGIVGASGNVTGVAPGASLMAYKIFDEQGQGTTADVIAAVELALDPDGDPDTDDGAHVINLSLGAPGTPDDALSQACDNAVLAGTVVVASAGNAGPAHQSVHSPGQARRVIGVGATDKTDLVWPGSSRGPVSGSWAIKPDVVAPGVAISSTIPGGYATGTGTSASAAHVSGAAALLLQLNPAWSPEWVEAALMNTARDVGRSPLAQGAGRIRVDQAATTPALILPASLSLGRVDASVPIWTHEETLVIHNVSSAAVSYALSVAGSFPDGVTVTVDPAQVTVPAGGSAGISFVLTVDTDLVPDVPGEPFAYWGALLATPTPEAPTLRVPLAFVKSPVLRLTVDEPNVSVMFVRDDPFQVRISWPPSTTTDYLLAAGTYQVAVQYQQPYDYVVAQVTLSESGLVAINLPRELAVHQARIAFTDERGQVATPNHAVQRFMWGGNGWLVSELAGADPLDEVTHFSDVPPQFTWERTAACADPHGDAYRQWHGRVEGMTTDVEFLTAPDDFVRVDHPLRAVPGSSAYKWYDMISYEASNLAFSATPIGPAVAVPYARRAYYQAPPTDHALYTSHLAMPDPLPPLNEGRFQSPWLQVDLDRNLAWRQPFSPVQFYWQVPSPATEPLGLGPVHWFARFDNNTSSSTQLVAAEGKYLFYRAYQAGDVSWEQRQPYELWQNGTLIQAGDLGATTGSTGVSIALPAPGVYSIIFPISYTLGSSAPVAAYGQVVATFDSTQYQTDADPPFVKVLRLEIANRPVDTAPKPIELVMLVDDEVDVEPSVSVEYDVGQGWVPVAVTQSGDEYRAQMPAFAFGTAVNLRVSAADDAGNSLVHTLEPAYLVRPYRANLPVVGRAP